jgi:hypothetical protein
MKRKLIRFCFKKDYDPNRVFRPDEIRKEYILGVQIPMFFILLLAKIFYYYVHWISEYNHVEIIDEDDYKYSVAMTKNVYKRKISLKRKYLFFSFQCSNEQYEKCFDFLDDKIKEKIPFGTASVYLNFIPFVSKFYYYNNKGKTYFCSELIADALKHAGLLETKIESCKISPDMLYKIIEDEIGWLTSCPDSV